MFASTARNPGPGEGPGTKSCTFSGKWSDKVDVGTLRQTGKHVEGKFSPKGEEIEGTATGKVLKAEVERGDTKWDAKFTLSNSCASFTYQYRDGSEWVSGGTFYRMGD